MVRATLHKVQPVLAYAAARLDRDLPLATLAAKARLSMFHLHRVFSAAAGETPKQFTLRLRLARAAVLLLTTRDSVLNVALNCGFQSHEAFSRAFRRRFGMTPSRYRSRGFAGTVGSAQAARHADLVKRVGPCIGLYRIEETQSEEDDMTYSIAEKELTAQPVLVVRRRVKRSEIAGALAEIYPHIFQYAQQSGIALAGPPMARYLDWGPGLTTIEAGFPVAAPAKGSETAGGVAILSDTLPAGPAATTIHAGPYDKLSEAHAAIQIWVEAQGLTPRGAPWESYIVDPGDHPDPADWKTAIFWPLAG